MELSLFTKRNFQLRLLCFLLLQFINFHLYAEEHSSCTEENIFSIERPLSNSSSKLKSFSYKYRYVSPPSSTDPVIIVIPGGPGSTSINNGSDLFGKHSGIVMTDPRGAGCNKNENFSKESFSSENIASDIAAIIKKEKIQNYIVYGQSYGTVPATILASSIDKFGIAKPKAVILEGIFNKDRTFDEWTTNFQSVLNKQFKKAYYSSLLRNEKWMSLNNKDKTCLIHNVIWWGTTYQKEDSGKIIVNDPISTLNLLLYDSNSELRNHLLHDCEIQRQNDEPSLLYKTLQCQELNEGPSYSYDLNLNSDNLPIFVISKDKNRCKGFRHSKPYKSKSFQIKTDHLYYFSGGQDPTTSVSDAIKHFKSQKLAAKKTFITLPSAGHPILTYDIPSQCRNDFWEKLLSGNDINANEVTECTLGKTTRLKTNNVVQ